MRGGEPSVADNVVSFILLVSCFERTKPFFDDRVPVAIQVLVHELFKREVGRCERVFQSFDAGPRRRLEREYGRQRPYSQVAFELWDVDAERLEFVCGEIEFTVQRGDTLSCTDLIAASGVIVGDRILDEHRIAE